MRSLACTIASASATIAKLLYALSLPSATSGAIISDDQTGRIFEINESAFVILTLLRASDDMQEVRELLRTVYPDASETDLAEQLSACIRQFADCGLIDYPLAA